jgi:diaminohydroxyphosphoribosylaminopyrimidine deaminase/5-amino-6-(5-phosphoribosylamino)uracil reductase
LQHEDYMQLALEEALKGVGRTTPNPPVGAVIVNNGNIVGRGYHKKAGTPHAEVNAIADAGEAARGGAIFVTLEPCNHTGRTPPCTQAILKAGIQHVVIGAMDPNPGVVGGGADFLRSQGVDVTTAVLEEACSDLIRPFVKLSSTGLPWVILKAGLSLDGRIAYTAGQGGGVTGAQSGQLVHQLRDQVDALVIGIGTALSDNPSLTTRIPGKADARDPLRVILDSQLRLSPNAQMLSQNSQAATWVLCGEDAPEKRMQALREAGAVVHPLPLDDNHHLDIHQVVRFLGKQQLSSLLVEGGARIHGAFWQAGLVDEVQLYYAPFFIGDQGVPLMQGFALQEKPGNLPLEILSFTRAGEDVFLRALVRKNL